MSFFSTRANLVPNDLNGQADVFVRELSTGRTDRVNVANDFNSVRGGVDLSILAAPVISLDGKRVAFASSDSRLVPNNANTNADIYSAQVPTSGRIYAGSLLDSQIGLFCFDLQTGQLVSQIHGPNTGFNSTNLNWLFMDVAGDRLFALQPAGLTSKILVFSQVSTRNGNVTPNRLMVFPDTSVVQVLLDSTRNKLYLRTTREILVYDNGASLNGPDMLSVPHRTIRPSADPIGQLSQIFLDTRRDELYVLTQLQSGARELSVFGSASTADGSPLPVRKLTSTAIDQLNSGVVESLVFLDPSPPSQDNSNANDAALLVADRSNAVLTFLSNGSRTGVIGNLSPDSQVAPFVGDLLIRGGFAQDLFGNTRISGRQVVRDLDVYNSGTASNQPNRVLDVNLSVSGGFGVDRTR